jgi:DNA-binding response OmpR family regulator
MHDAHILVVDDQKDVLAMIVRVSQSVGAEAGREAEGLKAFAAPNFDAVIRGVVLSAANGLGAIGEASGRQICRWSQSAA